MIDLSKEKLVLLAHAPPVTPGHPSAGTLRNWGREGIQGITLETVKLGGRRFTNYEAIARFFQRLNGQEEVVMCSGSAAG